MAKIAIGIEGTAHSIGVGIIEDIKEKLIKYEDLEINKMVIAIRKSESIEDPLKLFHDKVM